MEASDPTRHLWMIAIVLVLAVSLASALTFIALRRLHEVLLRRYPRALLVVGAAGRQGRDLVLSGQAGMQGRSTEAVEAAHRLLERDRPFGFPWLNCAVNALISAGQYRQALQVPGRWSKAFRRQERRRDPAGYLLVQINLAEALYNLGRFACAARLLDGITDDCGTRGSPLVREGLLLQKAWLSVLTGTPAIAIEHIEAVAVRHLPREYHAEVAFTRAAALRDLDRLDEARHEAERGLSIARRASSKRNALFLLGSIAARSHQAERAIELLEKGAGAAYRGQGGDGLLLLGDQYELMGRCTDCLRAYGWAAERDPQSLAGRVALRNLRKLGADTRHV